MSHASTCCSTVVQLNSCCSLQRRQYSSDVNLVINIHSGKRRCSSVLELVSVRAVFEEEKRLLWAGSLFSRGLHGRKFSKPACNLAAYELVCMPRVREMWSTQCLVQDKILSCLEYAWIFQWTSLFFSRIQSFAQTALVIFHFTIGWHGRAETWCSLCIRFSTESQTEWRCWSLNQTIDTGLWFRLECINKTFPHLVWHHHCCHQGYTFAQGQLFGSRYFMTLLPTPCNTQYDPLWLPGRCHWLLL